MIICKKSILSTLLILCLTLLSANCLASEALGTVSANIYGNLTNLSKLITAGSYIAGLGFAIASIMKFKAHKDNPTQVPVGTPAALVMIAASLLFLPSILGTTGATIFADGGEVATAEGTAWIPPTFSDDTPETAPPETIETPPAIE